MAALTLAPVLVGAGTRSTTGAAAVGVLYALSPLALLGGMRDPGSDLNFAILLWWFPFPTLAALVVLVDRLVGRGHPGRDAEGLLPLDSSVKRPRPGDHAMSSGLFARKRRT